jgi:hypothetical protein
MTWKTETKPGDVLRITKLTGTFDVEISDDAWAVVLDDEDMMVFIKRERDPRVLTSVAGWTSQVCPIGYADAETTQIALADEVPEDMPQDFWPLAARLALGDVA